MMLKRIFCVALSAALLVSPLAQQVTALEETQAPEDAQVQVAEEHSGVFVNGTWVEDALPTLWNETTYVSLRGVASALRPDAQITWDGECARVCGEGLSITVSPDWPYLVANGRYLYLTDGVYVADGNTMMPVRELAKALGALVWWDPDSGNVYLSSGAGAIVSGDVYYNSDSVYWLSHIIYAESGNQPLEGKISVGNVILNRVNSPNFPNTIYEVIFQRNQFTPVNSPSIQAEPNAESVIAAKLCLDGAVVLPDALWFNRANCNSWASRNRTYIATIGAHSFYG